MKYNTLTYSLKVWLTCVLAAPVLAIIILSYQDGMGFSDDLKESLIKQYKRKCYYIGIR